MPPLSPLPIDPVLPEVVRALAEPSAGTPTATAPTATTPTATTPTATTPTSASPTPRSVVLEAPPGAGKTTRVPRALLDAALTPKEIVVLEPRRLAARLAAKRVAEELGERLGDTVGYTVRFDDVSSKKTRVRFVTEGVLTRRLLADPELSFAGAVILDELHERHLHGDVALALLRRLQRTRRPDLRLVAMSATLDAAPVAAFLGCPVVRAEGRRFDVAVEHEPAPDDRPLERKVASAVRALLAGPAPLDGHVLVFLPGAAEIRRAREACEKLAAEHALELWPLHGDLPAAEQDRAVGPSSRRKIILSTNVAESSVTIEGVVAVVDSGLVRVMRHDPWPGVPALKVEKTSRASAVQRAGRAGRTRPGRALRLYTKADFDARPEHDAPEIVRADLTEAVLELRASGARDLEWLDPPREAQLTAAEDLLARLGALDPRGEITETGRAMLRVPAHPRQARVLLEAARRGVADDGCVLAAILGERDLRTSSRASFHGGAHGPSGARPYASDAATERSDALALLDLFREVEGRGSSAHAIRAAGLDPGAVHAVARASKQLARALAAATKHRQPHQDAPAPASPKEADDALLLAILSGFPDRVARRKKQGSRDLALGQGGVAELSEASAVRDAPFLVAVSAELVRGKPLVRVASAIEPEWLIDMFEERIREQADLSFDEAKGAVTGASKMLYDAVVIDESPGFDKADPKVAALLFERAWARGAHRLEKDGALDRWLARARFAASQDPAIKAPSDDDVARTLRAMCQGKTSLRELEEAGLLDTLRAEAGAYGRIDELAPERVTLASGRSAPITYEEGKPPWVASYLQDFFGTKTTPKAGRVPLVLHLLAPNKRAVQVTTDLEGFWERHYPGIRKELMRKYPRHAWPAAEDTNVAIPARRPRPRR